MQWFLVIVICSFIFATEASPKRSGGSRGSSDSGFDNYHQSWTSWSGSSFDNQWSSWSGGHHWSSWSGTSDHHHHETHYTEDEDRRFTYPNTKYILEGLAIYGATGTITKNRTTSSYGGITYHHGSRFYTKSSEDKLSCYYTPIYIYYAQYEDNQQVGELIFECDSSSQYCCELECCSTTAWWVVMIIIMIILGFFALFTCCMCCCSQVLA